jgi:hypothetical protein
LVKYDRLIVAMLQQKALQMSPEIRLTFTLMNGGGSADGDVVACWPFDQHLLPVFERFADALTDLAHFTIDSQVGQQTIVGCTVVKRILQYVRE